MKTLHIVSHTHWDREWYRTFQQFRLQLVHLVDNLLVILDNDPAYLHYMLDGQTIVLEDYLRVRMENFARLQKYIQDNRILIGPWYILPDEFLASAESTVRNLLIGKQICELFGQRMMIGYLPDPFGHIGQMPQILRGFNIDTAALWRGVKPEMPTAFTWQAPDGSQVLLAHLYYGYGNAAHWPGSQLERSKDILEDAVKRLDPHSNTSQYLMMQGTDHLEPHPATPENIQFYNEHNPDGNVALHSTLPAYFAALSDEIKEQHIKLPVHVGELRDTQKANLLPGVLSTRMWIKQRNWKAQTDLERWAEPFCAWAEILERGENAFSPITNYQTSKRVADAGTIIREAWKTLLKNQTHDSICGCSIDETHDAMIPRYDKVDQITKELQTQSLSAIAGHINTFPGNAKGAKLAITVFNAAPVAASGYVKAKISFPDDKNAYCLVDEDGNRVSCFIDYADCSNVDSNLYTIEELANMVEQTRERGYDGKTLLSATIKYAKRAKEWQIHAVLSEVFMPNELKLNAQFAEIYEILSKLDPKTRVRVFIDSGVEADLTFNAKNIPAIGYKTYWLQAGKSKDEDESYVIPADGYAAIENEWLKVTAKSDDMGFCIYDKRTGKYYSGLGWLGSVGDRGDEYNFTPTKNDDYFVPEYKEMTVIVNACSQIISIHFGMELPAQIDDETKDRSKETTTSSGFILIELPDNLPCVNYEVLFDNHAMDHKLEAFFDLGFSVKKAVYDGHFEIVERGVDLPVFDESWQEYPRPEVPQCAFVDVQGEQEGLMIANHGLPEVSLMRYGKTDNFYLTLTLLRSVGWLSKGDLPNRHGHAGPALPTPGAYELGTLMKTDMRVIPHDGNSTEARKLAYAFQTELTSIVSKLHDGTMKPTGSMIEADHDDFHITAVKEAENQEGYIVRGVNLSDQPIQVHLRTMMLATRAARVMLDESFMEDLALDDSGMVSFEAKPKEIVTVYFGLKA